jgi:DNA-binding CsgD family transcriptional regulator
MLAKYFNLTRRVSLQYGRLFSLHRCLVVGRRFGSVTARVSELIGEIYDCAVDSLRWQQTLDNIRMFFCCANATFNTVDIANKVERFRIQVGVDPYWLERAAQYERERVELYDTIPEIYTRPIDEPVVLSRDAPAEVFARNRYRKEWAQPQGICDAIGVWLMRQPARAGYFGMGRHESFGLIGDRDVKLLRLLAPHLRRAVAISDLLDMQTLKAEALGETLDKLAPGVVIAAADAGILHANCSARRMMKEGGPIRSLGGRIAAADGRRTGFLQKAIADAASSETELGHAGAGMAIESPSGQRATAHILPISNGSLRPRLLPGGAAAIFIASEPTPLPDLEPVAQALGLTRAETRLLGHLVRGEAVPDAAAALGIKYSTAHTQVLSILRKAGVPRQTNLVSLVHQLLPDVVCAGPERESERA